MRERMERIKGIWERLWRSWKLVVIVRICDSGEERFGRREKSLGVKGICELWHVKETRKRGDIEHGAVASHYLN